MNINDVIIDKMPIRERDDFPRLLKELPCVETRARMLTDEQVEDAIDQQCEYSRRQLIELGYTF
jgi:hypothetical protein